MPDNYNEVKITGEPDEYHFARDGKLVCTGYSDPDMEPLERWQTMGRDPCDTCVEKLRNKEQVDKILDDVEI